MSDSSNYLIKSKYYDNSNKLVVGKMEDETAGVAIKEFVVLKPKIHSYLVDDNSEHKKQKVWKKCCCNNKSWRKYVFLIKKSLRHWKYRIQSNDQKKNLMKSTRFLCLALMIKDTSKTMNVMD